MRIVRLLQLQREAAYLQASNNGNYSLLKALNHAIYGIYLDGALGDWGARATAPSARPQGVILMPLAFLMEHHSTEPSMIIKVIRT
jgi:hypothetical protein